MENQVKYCENCERNIAVNFDLHILHCKKNLKLCSLCEEPVRHDEIKEHLESMHTIELCDFCKKPFERWKLEKHQSDCPKKPLICKFCNLDVAADDFKEHAEMCWSRTEKCSICAQYVKLKDMEYHEKVCKNPSMMGIAECKFCKEPYPLHVIDTHESSCGNKTHRCPDCGELIKKYSNNHACKAKKNSSSVSVRSGKANGHDKNREVSSRPPFDDNHHSPNSFSREPGRNQAVELSPPVQKDLSDPKLNRTFKDRDSSIPIKCKLCSKYLIPQESRIHPEICPMRPTYCKHCQNHVPFNILLPELHQCRSIFMPPGYQKSGSSAMDELGRQKMYTAEYSSSSNLSLETSKIQTQDCPLCFKNFPMDRFDEHVRACAKGLKFCYFCKNEFFGDMEEHLAKCPGKETKKGKKKKEEKNEGFLTRGWNLIKKGKKVYSSEKYPEEKQLVVDGIPCEFCSEIYPFAEIAVHELGCLHEISQREERMKQNVSREKPKDEVPQASGYTPFDPSRYIIKDSYENKDRENKDRNKRLAEKSSKGVSSKFSSYSEPNQGIGNSHNHQSDVYYNDFYEKHVIKDHEREISARRSQKEREPRKAVEEGKKKEDVIFTYSSATKNKFSVQEKKFEQGARPKYQAREFPSKIYSSHKGLNCFSDSDEEIDSCQNKVKKMNLENNQALSSTVYTNDHKLNAIGSEREQKESSIESKNNNSRISNENDTIPNSSSQDVSSCVTSKKGSFNSDTSEDVYLSCDEGEEVTEARAFNKDAKLLQNEERDDEKLENCSIEKRSQSKEDLLQKYDITMSDLEKYVKKYKDANILKNEETDDRNCNREKRSLSSKEDRMERHELRMNDFEKYSKEKRNYNNHLKDIDSITSKSSTFLSHEEKHSLLSKYVMDIDNLEIEADRKNEETFASESLADMNDFEKFLKEKQNDNNHLKDIDIIRSKSSFISKYVMDIDELESEADRKNEETFASESRLDKNPFDSMTNSQFSYEADSSLPPYSSFNSDRSNHGGVGVKSDDNLDAYLQFLGLSDPEPDANYRLFEGIHGSKALEPDSSYGCLENVELGANNTNARVPKQTSDPQEPSVQMEELKGVSKNMSSYTSPFLLGNECEEEESVLSTTQRSFPVPLQEEKIREIGDKSRIDAKLQSQEEKDNEHNLKIWGTWRSPCKDDSDE